MSKPAAILQFEIDRKRWNGVAENDFSKHANYTDEGPAARLKYIARTAINDTIRNGGTFVLVASADKITMIQRPDAEEL
jgi:hypothetical protein